MTHDFAWLDGPIRDHCATEDHYAKPAEQRTQTKGHESCVDACNNLANLAELAGSGESPEEPLRPEATENTRAQASSSGPLPSREGQSGPDSRVRCIPVGRQVVEISPSVAEALNHRDQPCSLIASRVWVSRLEGVTRLHIGDISSDDLGND